MSWRWPWDDSEIKELRSQLYDAQQQVAAAENQWNNLAAAFQEYKKSHAPKETVENTIATEQYVTALHSQIESLSRANASLHKQIQEKIWTTLHKQTTEELRRYQTMYWEVRAKLEELNSSE